MSRSRIDQAGLRAGSTLRALVTRRHLCRLTTRTVAGPPDWAGRVRGRSARRAVLLTSVGNMQDARRPGGAARADVRLTRQVIRQMRDQLRPNPACPSLVVQLGLNRGRGHRRKGRGASRCACTGGRRRAPSASRGGLAPASAGQGPGPPTALPLASAAKMLFGTGSVGGFGRPQPPSLTARC